MSPVSENIMYEFVLCGQGFTVRCLHQYAFSILTQFLHPYTIFEYKRPEGSDWRTRPRWMVKDAYAVRMRSKHGDVIRLHRAMLKPLFQFLATKQVYENNLRIYEGVNWTPAPSTINLKPEIVPRDYQLEGMDFIDRDIPGEWKIQGYDIPNDYGSRIIGLRTGAGKTVLGIAAACRRGERIFMMMPPKYVDKWRADLQELTDIDMSTDYLECKGEIGIRRLIHQAKEGTLTASVIMIPHRTHLNFIKRFCEDLDSAREEFGINDPMDLYRLARPGMVLIDEAHEEFLTVYKALTFAAVPRVVKLSATFEVNENAGKRVIELLSVKEQIYAPEVIEAYTDFYPVSYHFNGIDKNRIVTTERGSTAYSQTAYEKFIMGNAKLLASFTRHVLYWTHEVFVKNYQPGDKIRLYFGSIAMCTHMTNVLKAEYPTRSVARYVEEDPYEDILTPEIGVTTVLSAGTAIDIPGLRFVLSWIAIASPRANKQLSGRLRKLKDRDVRFYNYYCKQIPKHVQYHEERQTMLIGRIRHTYPLEDIYGI